MDRSHLGGMRIRGIKDPLTAGIEQDIGCKACGKDHGTPLKAGIDRFFGLAQTDLAKPGEGNIEGADKDAQTDDQVIASHLITEEIADSTDG